MHTRISGIRSAREGSPTRGLFRRLVVINGLVFTLGTLILALSPATVSAPVLVTELPVLIIGLVLILAANALLVRTSLAPLDALATLLPRINLLHSEERLTAKGNGDLVEIVDAFNTMLDRLEAEHSQSSAHALAAQEGERQRVARELHDEIGQSLTVVLLNLKRTLDQAPEHLRTELHVTQEAVRDCLDHVRHVARRLRPGVLTDLGLASALAALTTEFSRLSGVPITRDVVNPVPELGENVELVIYRIAQEGLTNIIRHAHATTASLSLAADRDHISLRITDDGIGDLTREGAGIRGMRERAKLIDAELHLHSVRSGGTTVRLDIPIPNERT